MDKQAMLENAYQSGFEDEIQKIAADPEYQYPGYLKGLGGSIKAYYTDKPLNNIGRMLVGGLKGAGVGAAAGGAAGAGAGALAGLARRMRGAKGGVGKATAIGAGLGAYLAATVGNLVGDEKAYRKIMAEKGIRRKGRLGYLTGAHEFTPEAMEKYVKLKKKAA